MPTFHCHLLDLSGVVVRTEVLRASDEHDAHRDAMSLVMKIGRFAGYELWENGRRLAGYKPVASAAGED
jgi:hypothetical protein